MSPFGAHLVRKLAKKDSAELIAPPSCPAFLPHLTRPLELDISSSSSFMKNLLVALLAAGLAAQAQDVFKARLSPVPVDAQLARTVMGVGHATARLAGSRLTIEGTFEGMQSPATVGHIHMGAKMGVRGNPILDVTVAKSPAGALSGTYDLTPAQVEALKAGRLYIQIHAEKAPDGNLWGWLSK
jgi:hypothetical protein